MVLVELHAWPVGNAELVDVHGGPVYMLVYNGEGEEEEKESVGWARFIWIKFEPTA